MCSPADAEADAMNPFGAYLFGLATGLVILIANWRSHAKPQRHKHTFGNWQRQNVTAYAWGGKNPHEVTVQVRTCTTCGFVEDVPL